MNSSSQPVENIPSSAPLPETAYPTFGGEVPVVASATSGAGGNENIPPPKWLTLIMIITFVLFISLSGILAFSLYKSSQSQNSSQEEMDSEDLSLQPSPMTEPSADSTVSATPTPFSTSDAISDLEADVDKVSFEGIEESLNRLD